MKSILFALFLGLSLIACSGKSMSPDEPLTNRYWRVLEIDGQPVKVFTNKAEPHVILAADHKTHGSDGCNRFTGSYDDTQGLRFGRLASSMMACPPPTMAQARNFMKATEATVDYRIQGKTLELLDADGRKRMRLEATFLQ